MQYKDLIRHLEFNFPLLEREFLIDIILYVCEYKFYFEFTEKEIDLIFDVLENKKYVLKLPMKECIKCT